MASMKQELVNEKLKRLGLDIDFLLWLEGEADRLPRPEAVRDLKANKLVAAVRAAAWLKQLCFSHPDATGDLTRAQWTVRYSRLEEMLWQVIKSTMLYSLASQHTDLEALEHVLRTLLPESSWEHYRADILRLRRNGCPSRIWSRSSHDRRPRAGGKSASEQTERMRAAIAYLAASDTPYVDLAELWNNKIGDGRRYTPDEIKSRLRKGKVVVYRSGPAVPAHEFLLKWRRIYDGQLIPYCFLPFPLSRELRERFEKEWRQREKQKWGQEFREG